MPPLTPGTNKKVAELLKASFETWEKEVQNRNITKGKLNNLTENGNLIFEGRNNGLEQRFQPRFTLLDAWMCVYTLYDYFV